MNDNENNNEKLLLLYRDNKPTNKTNNYSKIVKSLRLALPFIALVIIVIVFSWDNTKDTIKTIDEAKVNEPNIGRNELLEPRFESRDKNDNPFSVTADKAISGENDPDLIQMINPIADMILNNGAWLAIKSEEGTYWQKDQKLKLTNDVRIYHNEGYEAHTENLDIDLNKQLINANGKFIAYGSIGKIEAKAMNADTKNGNLIFAGPAKLTLYNDLQLPQER